MQNLGYETPPTSTDVHRPFSITVGLKKGYIGSDFCHAETVIQAALNWMTQRERSQRRSLSGYFTESTLLYAWPDASGEIVPTREPLLRFSGEISITYWPDASDEEAKDILTELADVLANAAEQVRVYLMYNGKSWVRQAKGQTSPRTPRPAP